MRPYLDDGDVRLYQGDSLDVLRQLPSNSVDMVATSPPFFGLRDYGTGAWIGGSPDCDHLQKAGGTGASTLGAASGGNDMSDAARERSTTRSYVPYRDKCGKCGAVRTDQQLGREETPDEWANRLVAVFGECRRVLADHGTLWVEIGDSYATQPGKGDNVPQTKWPTNSYPEGAAHRSRSLPNTKPKDMVGQPWLLAFALRADGWYLRSEIIWHKPDVMPESVLDRPTRGHSTIFLLSKNPHYFYDADAIREPYKTLQTDPHVSRLRDPRPPQKETLDGSAGEAPRGPDGRRKTTIETGEGAHDNYHARQGAQRWPSPTGANARTVWSVPTESTSFAHFATWPQKLVAKMILAATSEAGYCTNCGSPWKRQHGDPVLAGEKKIHGSRPAADERGVSDSGLARSNGRTWRERQQLGWVPTCTCDADTKPGVVLDPFVGSGTTCLVARRLGRHSIGIELSERYLREIATPRLSQLSLLT